MVPSVPVITVAAGPMPYICNVEMASTEVQFRYTRMKRIHFLCCAQFILWRRPYTRGKGSRCDTWSVKSPPSLPNMTVRNFPEPKRGKRRSLIKKVPKRRPAVDRLVYASVPYVRHGRPSQTSRPELAKVSRSLEDLYTANDDQIVRLLLKDRILQHKAGKTCPHCSKGKLGKLKKVKGRGLVYRCGKCKKFVLPQEGHLILKKGFGPNSTSLQKQSAALLFAVQNADQSLTHRMTGLNHKTVADIFKANDQCRKVYVEEKEKDIKFGTDDPADEMWYDVEADEVDLRSALVDDYKKQPKDQRVKWEQWGGVQQRGSPKSLVMMRYNPKRTAVRAPGPGAIRTADWEPFATKRLRNRQVCLHTDGAKGYCLKVEGMLHDHVVHQKKLLKDKKGRPIKRDGKNIWRKPVYTKFVRHKIPNGKVLKVKAGTQIIDRAWQHFRNFLKCRNCKVGSTSLRTRIRSAQWVYWQRGQDLWARTGEMLEHLSK